MRGLLDTPARLALVLFLQGGGFRLAHGFASPGQCELPALGCDLIIWWCGLSPPVSLRPFKLRVGRLGARRFCFSSAAAGFFQVSYPLPFGSFARESSGVSVIVPLHVYIIANMRIMSTLFLIFLHFFLALHEYISFSFLPRFPHCSTWNKSSRFAHCSMWNIFRAVAAFVPCGTFLQARFFRLSEQMPPL